MQAMDWLRDYDPAATRDDFARARAAGLDTIRVFLRWEDAQPTASSVDAQVLRRLVDAADAAVAADASLLVTLFVGHMSGANWAPRWAVGGVGGDRRFRIVSGGAALPAETGLRNWYAEPAIGDAQERLASAAAQALSGHPGVWGWDLGNENSNCTLPPARAAGEAWLERMCNALRRDDPGRVITLGLHMEDLENDRAIGPLEAGRWCDVVSMHGYPIYADWAAGPTDDALAPFLAEITHWLSSGSPVLFEELGLPTAPPLDETRVARYLARTLDGLRRSGCVGAFLWCFSDYAAAKATEPPFDLAPHELSFGLWRRDGSAKPAVAEVSARASIPGAAPRPAGPWLDIDVATFEEDRRFHLARLYRRYSSERERS